MKLEEMRKAALSVNLNDSDKTIVLGHYVLDLLKVVEAAKKLNWDSEMMHTRGVELYKALDDLEKDEIDPWLKQLKMREEKE